MAENKGGGKKDTARREAKGRRCCLGAEFNKFLAALAILHLDDLKKRMNSFYT